MLMHNNCYSYPFTPKSNNKANVTLKSIEGINRIHAIKFTVNYLNLHRCFVSLTSKFANPAKYSFRKNTVLDKNKILTT